MQTRNRHCDAVCRHESMAHRTPQEGALHNRLLSDVEEQEGEATHGTRLDLRGDLQNTKVEKHRIGLEIQSLVMSELPRQVLRRSRWMTQQHYRPVHPLHVPSFLEAAVGGISLKSSY